MPKTIAGLQRAKKDLDDKLTKLLQDFEEDTGIRVRWIDIQREPKGPSRPNAPMVTQNQFKITEVFLDVDMAEVLG